MEIWEDGFRYENRRYGFRYETERHESYSIHGRLGSQTGDREA